jgi:hypothetical protein
MARHFPNTNPNVHIHAPCVCFACSSAPRRYWLTMISQRKSSCSSRRAHCFAAGACVGAGHTVLTGVLYGTEGNERQSSLVLRDSDYSRRHVRRHTPAWSRYRCWRAIIRAQTRCVCLDELVDSDGKFRYHIIDASHCGRSCSTCANAHRAPSSAQRKICDAQR